MTRATFIKTVENGTMIFVKDEALELFTVSKDMKTADVNGTTMEISESASCPNGKYLFDFSEIKEKADECELTEKEQVSIVEIADNMEGGLDSDVFGWFVCDWSQFSEQACGGLFSSLNKKGYISLSDYDGSSTSIEFTEKGRCYLDSINYAK